MPADLNELLGFAKSRIVEAGKILMHNFDNPSGIKTKDDNTLVSDADAKSSDYLSAEFQKAFPGFGLLDEERKDDGSRFSKEYVWVIDPLDDTAGYVKYKTSTFGVLIGLLRNNVPILGVTYRPAADELCFASEKSGAYLQHSNDNPRVLRVNPATNIDLLVSMSRSSPEFDNMIASVKPRTITRKGGSLKIIDVAKGEGTLFLCHPASTMHLWDLCGPQVILQEAGGVLSDCDGDLIDYAQEGTANQYGVIASNGAVHQYAVDTTKYK